MIQQLSETLFQCDSKSNPESSHFVSIDNGVISCDCIGYKYRHTCRHVKEVMEKRQNE